MELKGYNDESFDKFQEQKEEENTKGFELIKKFVQDYPNTEYPSVDDKLIETFCRGAKLLGIHHLVLPEDEGFCPDCKYPVGKVGNGSLSLHIMEGSGKDSTLCVYCSYGGCVQDLGMKCDDWNVQEEHDYYCNAILKEEQW